MNSLRRHLFSAAALCVVAASCAGGSDASSDEPEVSLGTVPNPAEASDATSPGADSTASEPSATDATATESTEEPATSEPESTEIASTTVLTPSPDADLPTQATPTEPVPVTTQPGPLPAPDVQLTEIATFAEPVEATGAPGDPRLFIVENGGTIVSVDAESNQVVFDVNAVDATSFTDGGNEQGLLGLAFHPELDLAYVNYTDAGGDTIIAEFAHDPVTYQFDPVTFRQVLVIDQTDSNHNGGELAFGPDGYLYIGTGDGGSADDPNRASLDLSSPLGKILRIDPLENDVEPFTIPGDNPFVGVAGADESVWSLGLRNPWRFSFDSLTGDLWIADVGQNQFEEIDLAPAVDGVDAGRGISFGWSAYEGAERFNDDQPADGHTLPVVTYGRDQGCSVSGGVVARNSSYADLNGWYIYGDYCTGLVWALDTTSVASTPDGPVGTPVIVQIAVVDGLSVVAEGPFGDIYAMSINGAAYRLDAA